MEMKKLKPGAFLMPQLELEVHLWLVDGMGWDDLRAAIVPDPCFFLVIM